MGWKWVDEESNSIEGRGFGDVGELEDRIPASSPEKQCSTRRYVSSECRTEQVEPGKFVRRCQKTEQVFRDCFGRPSELVESKTERYEDDITDQVKNGMISFGSSGAEPFSFPGLRSDIEAIERGLRGGIGNFLEAAEEMANSFFSSFPVPPMHDSESSIFDRRERTERQSSPSEHCGNESGYSKSAVDIKEV